MSSVRDPYEVLGLPTSATDEDVRSAYRALCQIFHPDRFDLESTEVLAQAMNRMQEVNSAYAALHSKTGTKVYYETDGWTNVDRGRVTAKLLNRGISHSWTDEELVIDRQFEGAVDQLLDQHFGG